MFVIIGSTDDFKRLRKAVLELVQVSIKSKMLAFTISYIGLCYWYFKFLRKRPHFLDNTIEALKRDKFEIPILSFCSKADDLIDYRQTLEFLNERQKNVPNLKIEIVLFDDYTQHTEVYMKKLKKHLEESKIPLNDDAIAKNETQF